MKKRLRKLSIPQLIALGFASTILLGSILLMLPISSNSGEMTSFTNALFTATSAVCVTGQTVLNTAEHWSYFGKSVILILIEVGGLGFMTLIVMLFMFMGKKLNLRQRRIVADVVNSDSIPDGQTLIRYIIKFSLSVQLLGAFILSLDFIPRLGLLKGAFFSVFHAVSAFCNAGFDLFGNSLEGFTQNPLVMMTIASLIFFGGLGFIVWRDVLTYRKNRKLLLHTKLTLFTTLSILLVSFLLLLVSELQNGTFSDLSLPLQIMNIFFMAVTPRTAGYANVNYQMVSPMGIFLTMILMFIGASSGSTGGGIKVTTLATLVLYVRSKFMHIDPKFANRSIAKAKIVKSIMIVTFGVLLIVSASFILLLTETIPHGFGIEYVLMEVFSCFGTVGLSMGLTPDLTMIGKFVLIIVMFAGRIGLLTFFMSVGGHSENRDTIINYPEGSILVG